MLKNRSMPECTVIPVLQYPDVEAAVTWLCDAFGFRTRLRIGTHRCQLDIPPGEASVVVAEGKGEFPLRGNAAHSVMVRVEDVDAHHEQASAFGAQINNPPATFPYGERQYSAVDPAGHVWTFSQTVEDIEPAAWGGELVQDGPGE